MTKIDLNVMKNMSFYERKLKSPENTDFIRINGEKPDF